METTELNTQARWLKQLPHPYTLTKNVYCVLAGMGIDKNLVIDTSY